MLKRLALALKLDEQRLGELLSGSVQVRAWWGESLWRLWTMMDIQGLNDVFLLQTITLHVSCLHESCPKGEASLGKSAECRIICYGVPFKMTFRRIEV
jgi:hypothetical protein